jgi:hypothetical protein
MLFLLAPPDSQHVDLIKNLSTGQVQGVGSALIGCFIAYWREFMFPMIYGAWIISTAKDKRKLPAWLFRRHRLQ